MPNWFLIIELLYLLVLVIVCARIIYDTNSTVKTLGLLVAGHFSSAFWHPFLFRIRDQLPQKRIVQ